MSEKYTIEQFAYRADTIAIVEAKTNVIICESASIDDARLICHLLNEEEKRKAMPKIYKPYKDMFLSNINQKLKWFKEQETNGLKAGEFYKEEIIICENSIKAIESLESNE